MFPAFRTARTAHTVRALIASALLLGLAACTGGDDDKATDDTNSTVDDGDIFSEVITLEETLGTDTTGALSCYTPGGEWVSETPDPSCQVTADIQGIVEDFESEDPVEDATLEFFYGDIISGSPDDVMSTDSDGFADGAEAPTCTPVSYRVSTDPDLDETKVTIEAHQIFNAVADGDPIDTTFNSVSSDTYAIIPSLLGISVDPEKGIIAGTAYDCDEQEIEGVQVIVRDANGDYAVDQEVRYFVEDFPNRDQPYTSEDGLWIAINIPPGRVTVEMWAISGGELVQVAATELDLVADSINISNMKLGYGDGVFYPTDCLSACD